MRQAPWWLCRLAVLSRLYLGSDEGRVTDPQGQFALRSADLVVGPSLGVDGAWKGEPGDACGGGQQ